MKLKNNNGKGKEQEPKQITTVVADIDVFIISDEGCVNIVCQDSRWFIDLGASYHIVTRADFFTSFISRDFGFVRMENDGASKTVGMGDIVWKPVLGTGWFSEMSDIS